MKVLSKTNVRLRTLTEPPPEQRLVLYVEDDVDNWAVTELFLRRRFDLVWAKSDAEACDLIAKHGHSISLILMDIELKGSQLDGITLTRLLRGERGNVPLPDFARNLPPCEAPIFFVSAYTSRYSEEELRRAGASRLVPKPVDFAALSMALSEVQVLGCEASGLVTRLHSAQDRQGIVESLATSPRISERIARVLRTGVVGQGSSAGPPSRGDAAHTLDAVRAASVAEAILEQLPPSVESEALLANVLRRAVAGRLLAEATGLASPADAFTVGLLLDAGLIARARHDVAGALAVARSPAASRLVRECASGEVGHAERGVKMGAAWQLPPALLEAVGTHHDVEPPASALGRLAWLAEALAGVFEAGAPIQNHRFALRAATACGVSHGHVSAILDALPKEVSAAAAALGRRVSVLPSLADMHEGAQGMLAELSESYTDLVRTLQAVIEEKNFLAGQLRDANAALHLQVDTDLLTGVANRRAFTEALQRAIGEAQHHGLPLSLMMVDVDHFKRINDELGHPAGDAVLKEVAARIASGVRSADVLARYGGEEFIVLLPATQAAEALGVAERLRRALAETPIETPRGQVIVTASFGVACCATTADEAADGDALIQLADEALYEAKGAGRNTIRLSAGHPEAGSAERVSRAGAA